MRPRARYPEEHPEALLRSAERLEPKIRKTRRPRWPVAQPVSLPAPSLRPLVLTIFLLLLLVSAGGLWLWKRPPRGPLFSPVPLADRSVWTAELPNLEAVLRGEVVHSVQRGDTLASVAQRYGVESLISGEIQQALNVLGKEKDIQTFLKVGEKVIFRFSAKGLLTEMSAGAGEGQAIRVSKRRNAYVARLQQIPHLSQDRVVMGEIRTSFASAALNAGVSYDVIDDLVDLFSDRIVFHRDFRVGDRFAFIFRGKVTDEGDLVDSGPIMAAAFEVKGERFAAVRYVGVDGKARYFNEKGELLGNTFLRYPLKFSRISSYYTDSRLHPVLGIRRPHRGIDFAAPIGTPVRAVADGWVLFAGRDGGNGIIIKLRHNERFGTGYAHLSRISPGVRRGARVKRGETIGAVGTTGLSTGPHLHFCFYDNGRAINPLSLKLPTLDTLRPGMRIDAKYLQRALYTLLHYQVVDLRGLQDT